ncbi:hypothetical protein BH23CHL2_BH23CHL2_34290 [soil metagenome]
MSILIERRLGTVPFWMPIERGWVEVDHDVQIIEAPTAADVRAHNGPMLVDALLASTVIASSRIITDHAVAADTISLLTMITASRPDEIEQAAVSTPGFSLSGRAAAEIVIPEFYGVAIAGWLDEPANVDAATIIITEDADALLPTANEEDYHEDLGRAWFLLTNTPFVSHILIVPERLYLDDIESVRSAVRALSATQKAATDQRRMLRRNISRDHDIDRDLVVDVFDGLKFELSKSGRDGLTMLYERSGVIQRTGPVEDRFETIGDASR